MKKDSFKIKPHYIIDSSGKKQQVILDIKTFEQILEQLEDQYFTKEAKQILEENDFIDFDEANKDIIKK